MGGRLTLPASFKVPWQQARFWLAYGCICLILWLIFGVYLPGRQHAANRAQLAKNLHQIQLGIERYAVDHEGNYPGSTSRLIAEGYLDALPGNPYTGEPMAELALDSTHTIGDFVYIPVYPGGLVEYGADSYYLEVFFSDGRLSRAVEQHYREMAEHGY